MPNCCYWKAWKETDQDNIDYCNDSVTGKIMKFIQNKEDLIYH